jgi:hypothetical protein
MENLNSAVLESISYEFFEKNRFTITDFKLEDTEYSAICNNGWIKLHTTKGKVYWLAQNELNHVTPDWKFHVSVVPEDIPRAWNLVTKIFLEMRCQSGMKTAYLKENTNTAKGREITIYIYQYVKGYSSISEIGKQYGLNLSDEHSENFWIRFFNKIEEILSINNIRSNGLANGDKKLGKYTSLRNEAYVRLKNELVYPPDNFGWNAARQSFPFNYEKFRENNSHVFFSFKFLVLVVLLASIGLAYFKNGLFEF